MDNRDDLILELESQPVDVYEYTGYGTGVTHSLNIRGTTTTRMTKLGMNRTNLQARSILVPKPLIRLLQIEIIAILDPLPDTVRM